MKDDVLRQRRNLIAVAVGLTLYEISGGQPKDTPTFMGLVNFSNPDVLIYFAWLTLLYFTWRYWIHTAPHRLRYEPSRNGNKGWSDRKTSWQAAFQYSLARDRRYRSFVRSMMEPPAHESETADFAPLLVRGLYTRKLDFSLIEKFPNEARSHRQGDEMPVGYLRVFPYEIKAQLVAALSGTAFSDYALPYYAAALPGAVWISKRLIY